MGSLGVSEIAFIFILALLIFGPKRLPELGRTVGKGLSEFRKASNDLKRTINSELALEELPAPPQQLARRVPAGTIAAPLAKIVSAAEPSPYAQAAEGVDDMHDANDAEGPDGAAEKSSDRAEDPI